MTRRPFGEEQMNRAVQHLLTRPHFHAAIPAIATILCGVTPLPDCLDDQEQRGQQ